LVPKNVKIKIYKIIILPALLYGCETLSDTLMKEHGLRMFQNRVLRGIFGRKRDEATGGEKNDKIKQLHNPRSSPDIRRIR
jgi:hypothetical protein